MNLWTEGPVDILTTMVTNSRGDSNAQRAPEYQLLRKLVAKISDLLL